MYALLVGQLLALPASSGLGSSSRTHGTNPLGSQASLLESLPLLLLLHTQLYPHACPPQTPMPLAPVAGLFQPEDLVHGLPIHLVRGSLPIHLPDCEVFLKAVRARLLDSQVLCGWRRGVCEVKYSSDSEAGEAQG